MGAPAHKIVWAPNPGPQTLFLATTASEVLYGGAAGGGKSDGLVVMPLRWVGHPRFRALILRREFARLGQLIERSQALYRAAFPGAKYTGDEHSWTFPSGAKVRFGHCQHDDDVYKYLGDEYQLIELDELTTFTLRQYRELRTRIRSPEPGLPRATRATSNPGGAGHAWVFERFGPWLDPKYEGLARPTDRAFGRRPPARPGEVLWYLTGSDGRDVWVPRGTPGAQSRTFIPARLTDNPHLAVNDPDYGQRLRDNDPVRRAQLEDGNWLVQPAAGQYFKRAWVKEWLDAPPAAVDGRVRYWDLAAGGDYAVGARYSRAGRLWVVEDVERLRGTPHQVRQAVYATTVRDGKTVSVWVERDPGQAGKDQEYSYVSAPELQGYTVRFRPKRVDKITAFGPFSAQAQAGLVAVVRGGWNVPLFEELEAFPEGANDDQCDALSGAHAVLTGGYAPAPATPPVEDASRLVGLYPPADDDDAYGEGD